MPKHLQKFGGTREKLFLELGELRGLYSEAADQIRRPENLGLVAPERGPDRASSSVGPGLSRQRTPDAVSGDHHRLHHEQDGHPLRHPPRHHNRHGAAVLLDDMDYRDLR